MSETSYVYKWTHIPTYKWYIGSRTSKNAHPDDGYICSSKTVKPMILSNPNEWKREVLAIGSSEEMYNFETELLIMFDAKNDERSFNMHNNDAKCNMLGKKHSSETKSKISKSNKGKSRWSDEDKIRLSMIAKNREPISEESRIKISKKLKGKPSKKKGIKLSDETKLKMSISSRGTYKERGIVYPTTKCPHCDKEGGKANMKRYHFDNCKFKGKNNE